MSSINDFIDSIAIGNIYWFVNPQISSPEPHPYICLGMDNNDDCVFLLCGTSQFQTKRRHFEINNLPPETLVKIQSGAGNSITKDTYIDCNDIQYHNVEDLFYDRKPKLKGKVTKLELSLIREGIEVSELLETATQKLILKMFPEI